jgi:hypothetical protein
LPGVVDPCLSIKDKEQFVKCLQAVHGDIFQNLHLALKKPHVWSLGMQQWYACRQFTVTFPEPAPGTEEASRVIPWYATVMRQ